jgi:hypothetical protein
MCMYGCMYLLCHDILHLYIKLTGLQGDRVLCDPCHDVHTAVTLELALGVTPWQCSCHARQLPQRCKEPATWLYDNVKLVGVLRMGSLGSGRTRKVGWVVTL